MSITNDINKIKNVASEYSLLTKREEIDLVTMLNQANPKYVRHLAVLFKEDPRWVIRIYESYCIKKQAVLRGDKKEWDEIIAKEIREIDEYLSERF